MDTTVASEAAGTGSIPVGSAICYNDLIILKYMAKKAKVSKAKTRKPAKKSLAKPAKVKKEKPIGEILHYYDNIKVAVIKCKDAICVGQELHIVGGEDTDFSQKIASMQFDHKPIKKAK